MDNKKASTIVHKAVQTNFDDIQYKYDEVFIKTSTDKEHLAYDVQLSSDPYSYTVVSELLLKISYRIEFATQLNVTKRYASTRYQTTNYGLSGMVDHHMDSSGYEHGQKLTEDRKHLILSGDKIATFMGWLQNTEGGGSTVFPSGKAFLKPVPGPFKMSFLPFSKHYKY